MDDRYDTAIIGGEIAGVSLAAALIDGARVVLIEAESQPGYHATGRSAAILAQSYGSRMIRALTAVTDPWFASPADETPAVPADARPEEIDIAICLDRIARVFAVAEPRPLSTWAGLRTFAPDRSQSVAGTRRCLGSTGWPGREGPESRPRPLCSGWPRMTCWVATARRG